MAGLALSSYGQGYIFFANYNATPYYAVVYGNGPKLGTQVGAEASVELGWANGSGVTSGFTLLPSSITAISATLSQADNGSGPSITGWFYGPTVQLLEYSGGAVSFEMLATAPSYAGSLIWTEPASAIATGLSSPGEFTAMTGDVVMLFVPEPTTLALAGLGGLALLAFRRKQA